MNQFISKLKKFRKDKKGVMAIEIIIGMMLFLLVLCFLMDILILTWKFGVVSQTSSYVTRQAGIQGGILSSAPDGFPGGDSAYLSSGEMRNQIRDIFDNAGIEEGDYQVYVNGTNIASGSSTERIDYMDTVEAEVEIQYEWEFLSNFIPGSIEHSINSRRSAVSEFKYRYNEWVGE